MAARTLKIGIVCYPTFGGSGVVATELGKALAGRGHEVHFIAYKRPVRLDAYVANIHYHQVNPESYPLFEFVPYETALASRVVDVARAAKLDILHVHYAIPHASASYMAQRILEDLGYQLPYITTLHGTDITLVGREEIYEPVVTFSINHSTGVTAVSDYLRKATLEHFDVNRPIEVIPNFVDIQRFKFGAGSGFRDIMTPKGEKLLIHISNFRPVKRVQDVYAVFKRVQAVLPTKLLFVGDGPERPEVERRAREEGHEQDVVFLGKQQVIEQILPEADLFLMPSETESFGLAVLEAMACGLPAIASQAGGLPEVIDHGKTGYLSPIGDVDDMAEKALKIIQDEATHQAFREAAKARAQNFDLPKIVPLYEAYYQRVLEGFWRK